MTESNSPRLSVELESELHSAAKVAVINLGSDLQVRVSLSDVIRVLLAAFVAGDKRIFAVLRERLK